MTAILGIVLVLKAKKLPSVRRLMLLIVVVAFPVLGTLFAYLIISVPSSSPWKNGEP